MTGWRERVEELLVAEATDSLSSEQSSELEALLRKHPETDRHAIELAAGSVFLAAVRYRPDGFPDALYQRLLEQGTQLVAGSD